MPVTSLPGLVVIGGGPAGLMAAETARAAGQPVHLFEAKASVGRKFLIAGKGGLNLTHGEPLPDFVARYRERRAEVGTWLADFSPQALREWAAGLGVETFVGSSGRVFPRDLKAAPLLRGWVRRLRDQGVAFHVQHRFTGFRDGLACFETPQGEQAVRAAAFVLALGGGSWPALGSDGAWVAPLRAAGVDVADLQPANCGFDVGWSEAFATRHAGAPLKPVRAAPDDGGRPGPWRQGEMVATATGVEGSLVYALSAVLRERIGRDGGTQLWLDLVPGRSQAALARALAQPRGKRSLSEHLRRKAGLSGVQAALLFERLDREALADPDTVAAAAKALPLPLRAPRPIAEAISSAGGVRLEGLDEGLMLARLPGVFCAGEMLDWEAPTGGYLLSACFASGRRAGAAAARWLQARAP